MKPEYLFEKAIHGIKWTIIISMLTMGATYFLQLFLAKISTEALGIYATFDIYIKTVSTFIIFGGAPVLSNYIPKLKNEYLKYNFVISYSLIVFILMIFGIALLLLFPEFISFIFAKEINRNVFLSLILLTPLIVINFLIQYVLNGLLQIKTSKTLQQLYIIGTTFVVLFCYFIMNSIIINSTFWILLISIFFFNLVSLLIGIISIYNHFFKDRKLSWRIKDFSFYLPSYFWNFALFIHVATFFAFFEKYVLKFCILDSFSIEQLGIFQFILMFYMGSREVVIIFNQLLTPIFSTFEDNLRRLYFEFTRFIPLIIVIFNGFIITFIDELILMINSDYLGFSHLIVLLIVFSTVGCLGIINTNIIIVKGKTFILMLNGILQILLVLIFYLIMGHEFNLFYAVVLQGLLLLISQIFPFVYVLRHKYPISVNYVLSVVSIALLAYLNIFSTLSFFKLTGAYVIALVIVFKLNYEYLQSNFIKYRDVLL